MWKDDLFYRRFVYSRVFAALCRLQNKTEEMRGFVFNVAYSSAHAVHLGSTLLLCQSVWPQLFSNGMPPTERQVISKCSISNSPISCALQILAVFLALKQGRTLEKEVGSMSLS